MDSPNYRQKKHVLSGWKDIGTTLLIIVCAPLLAVLITIFVFQSYEVYGMSMETTLQNGDRLIVQKISKNWAKLQGDVFIPNRYQIVVFDKPPFLTNGSQNQVDHLIKRVIGLPGERVVVKDGSVTVYNAEFPNGFNPDQGQEYAKSITKTQGDVDVTIGQEEIFVMGDNRNNSLDSRSFGPVSSNFVTGVATLRFLPVGSFDRL